jgi:hypothetical protein
MKQERQMGKDQHKPPRESDCFKIKDQILSNGVFTLTWVNTDTIRIEYAYSGGIVKSIRYIDGGDFEMLIGALCQVRSEE